LPQYRRVVYLNDPTPAERRSLLLCRLECLAEACKRWNGGEYLAPNERVGWRAVIKTLGRDQDGSCLASVTVYDPSGEIAMLRNVRLVRERRLKLKSG
jgi:hypothetical protein